MGRIDTSDAVALVVGIAGALVGLVALYYNWKTTQANEAMAAANTAMAATNERMARANEDLVRLTETMQTSAEKAENIKNLLGEKETVGYAALKVRRDGLPTDAQERRVVPDAILHACVFEHSARARALLYKVLEENLAMHRLEIEDALQVIEETFTAMEHYEFTKEELGLERGKRRIATVRRVIEVCEA